VVLVTFQIFSF